MLELSSRERLVRAALGRPVDRGVFFSEHYWSQTWDRWQTEGMPAAIDFDYDFDFHAGCLGALGVNIGFQPAFATEVLQDDGATQVVRDQYGVIKRVFRDRPGQLQQFLEHPVKDRTSWDRLVPRLAASGDMADRLPAGWTERAGQLNASDRPVFFGGTHLCGFFSFLRELAGENVYYLLHDDPGLMHDMLDFQTERLIAMVRRVSRDVRLDGQFIWEDMCFKTGPLIGPRTFRDFLLEPYCRLIEAAKACGVRIFYVDSDGNLDALLPLWLEAGVNAFEPFEVAAGMDVVRVKRQYGDRLAAVGGIDKRALAAGRQAIDAEIERVRPAYEMGGYLPAVDHSVPPDVAWDDFRYYLDRKRRLVGKD